MAWFTYERARTQSLNPADLFDNLRDGIDGELDAVFLKADRCTALGFAGLPYTAPVCSRLLNSDIGCYFYGIKDSSLIYKRGNGFIIRDSSGEKFLPDEISDGIQKVLDRVLSAPGKLNERGELILDLMTYPVGTHYPVNLLLGNRAGYERPLLTTPKSSVDALGRGSFRGSGSTQILATRCVLQPEENGEPANRQFYITENGRQIFYSANVHDNVTSAECVHSQDRTVITYKTSCGLDIKRTIFILPQEPGMPNAVEAQRVEITNTGVSTRMLQIVFTGMFGITDPATVANDIVYANIVAQSELFYKDGAPVAVALHHKPSICDGEKRFALLLCNGEAIDSFATSLPDFIGSGSLDYPEMVCCLDNKYSRKMAPFFALGKNISAAPGESAIVDSFVGMVESDGDVMPVFDASLKLFIDKYSNPTALESVLNCVIDFWNRYPAYLIPRGEDKDFNSYVSGNLPFQTLYQTYVSRSFAWTQKSYRETGFREIQDIYASMYYLSSIGENKLIKNLLGNWISNVFRMGYAYHNFTFRGKEPGDCSDDQLWLLQAVDRYIKLTGDYAFLDEEYPVAGEDVTRSLWDTIMAIITYSGKISVGKHGMPLLDKADWNDTLRLDSQVMQGPEKECLYLKQLSDKAQEYGAPLENEFSESVMNACLLIIAADIAADLARKTGRIDDGKAAEEISAGLRRSMQKNAWKGDFFARCLINDGRGYEYLGAGGDGLSLNPDIGGTYFLNTFSWPILAGCATEEQIEIMLNVVNKYLKTEAGLKLCTLVDFDKLHISCGTQLYFPGDRENGGVFKHAAMMAAVAALKAAKQVSVEDLALKLRSMASFMIDRVLPYTSMKNPYVLKGNPRFCTQYNNSETGENIGPMLSGTASWLTLAVFELAGIEASGNKIFISPILRDGENSVAWTFNFSDCTIHVSVDGSRNFRPSEQTEYTFDGKSCGACISRPSDNHEHYISVKL